MIRHAKCCHWQLNVCFRASGTVYLAKCCQDGKFVAIKQMELETQPKKEHIVTEIEVDCVALTEVNFSFK